MSFANFLTLVQDAIRQYNGDALADLLTYDHPSKKVILQSLRNNPEVDVESICKQRLGSFGPMYEEMIASHLRFLQEINEGHYVSAYGHQANVATNFQKVFQGETSWLLPVLYKVNFDLAQVAEKADQELAASGLKPSKLEQAENTVKRVFAICMNDRTALHDGSKKQGALMVINCLFKMYFKLNKLRLCKNLMRHVDQPGFPEFDNFSTADRVTYRFFSGRLSMFEDNYSRAEEELMYALEHCNRSSFKNKRLILQYLVPVRLILGHIPSPALLAKYRLQQYADISTAIRTGNLALFNQSLLDYNSLFIRHGVFLILEKSKTLVYRNLFKKTQLILKSAKLPLAHFQQTLRWQGEEMDTDEVECIIANLIFSKYIKGYISHQKSCLVVSNKDPFPLLKTLLREM